MAVSQNKLLPVMGVLAILIIGAILYQQYSDRPQPVKSADAMKQIPKPQKLPAATGADGDNSSETLKTVVVSNADLRKSIEKLLEENKRIRSGATGSDTNVNASPPVSVPTNATEAPTPPATAPVATANTTPTGANAVIDVAGRAAETFMGGFEPAKKRLRSPSPAMEPEGVVMTDMGNADGAIAYKTVAPMGYAKQEEKAQANRAATARYVRTLASTDESPKANSVVRQAVKAAKAEDEAYFTIPENATLVGVQAMTAIIGRVPIDGRVTDPMQFKALIGRDNLAANGWELPDDLAGMIVTGIAIGDMALSCSEGKIRSLTFVFNDGVIRTVSSRGKSSGAGGGSSSDLGFISDLHGNPCIVGKFVTNAPRHLADIVGLKTLGVAGQAYATAQQQITQGTDGSTSSRVLQADKYVMGQAVAGATDEVTQWMLSRLKNSFDAVVTPSGQKLVVHLDREIRLDKQVDARKIIHRTQAAIQNSTGAHHGLE